MSITITDQTARAKIKINQGATFNPILTYEDDNGALVDLTGYTARMQVRKNHHAESFLLELTTENGGIVLGDANGTIELVISAITSSAFSWVNGVYDFELVNGAVVTRLFEGTVTVNPEVTR